VRFLATAACFFFLGTFVARTENRFAKIPSDRQQSQEQKMPAAASDAPKSTIDPAKEADIRALLAVAGTDELVAQALGMTEKSIRPTMMSSLPPGDYRERLIDLFLVKVQSKMDSRRFVEMAVPVYDKYLSDQDVKDLTAFYGTPLGKKTLTVLPKMMAELQEQGTKMGEAVGRQSMEEVLAEHPDLKQALIDAAAKVKQ
jgi:uncharacterized protein